MFWSNLLRLVAPLTGVSGGCDRMTGGAFDLVIPLKGEVAVFEVSGLPSRRLMALGAAPHPSRVVSDAGRVVAVEAIELRNGLLV